MAHLELEQRASEEASLASAWRAPKGEFRDLRCWSDEVWPLLIYADHTELGDETLIQITEEGTEGIDFVLDTGAGEHLRIEMTTTFREDDALRDQMLNQEGSVFAFTPILRNRKSKRLEYSAPHSARGCEEALRDWATRISEVLKKKQRPGYGRGSTLVVYAYGMSGDMARWRRETSIEDVIRLISPDAYENDFDRTVLMSWHPGWLSSLRRHSGRA